jgi:hypothetical protein
VLLANNGRAQVNTPHVTARPTPAAIFLTTPLPEPDKLFDFTFA